MNVANLKQDKTFFEKWIFTTAFMGFACNNFSDINQKVNASKGKPFIKNVEVEEQPLVKSEYHKECVACWAKVLGFFEEEPFDAEDLK